MQEKKQAEVILKTIRLSLTFAHFLCAHSERCRLSSAAIRKTRSERGHIRIVRYGVDDKRQRTAANVRAIAFDVHFMLSRLFRLVLDSDRTVMVLHNLRLILCAGRHDYSC